MFRTSKCSHGDKGMCINCMVNKNRTEKNVIAAETKNGAVQCKHPNNMKCLRCLPQSHKQEQCQHPDYQKCKNCQHLLKYDKFTYFLEKQQNDCNHKKPCSKCVPPLSRKTYFIDKDCKKHAPYPSALCDACMAPTLTITQQNYAHISQVVIRTTSIYRILQANLFGILLGRVENDVVIVQDVYFPEEQELRSNYINPETIQNYSHIFQAFNLKEVGLLYCSQKLTGFNLMLSSLFQQKYLSFQENHQMSRFVTMRLQMGGSEQSQPHFECFMVSDQLQAFHKNGIIYEQQIYDNCFDLITVKSNQLSQLPTFLREGVQTDKIYFKEALVWIHTLSQQNFRQQTGKFAYPYFTLQNQGLQDFKRHLQREGEPLQKYSNIQFLLHLNKLIGRQSMINFMINFIFDAPDVFLMDKLQFLERKEKAQLQEISGPTRYHRSFRRE